MMKYFDFAATTPVDPLVREAMLPYLEEEYCNASGLYDGGRRARAAVEGAREKIHALMHTSSGRIFFTSGGTEADNTALFGTAFGSDSQRKTIAVSAIEHHAVLDSALFLEKLGYKTRILPVDPHGRIDPDAFREMVDEEVLLVSVMWANNEIGAVQDIPVLAEIAHEKGALFHTDAVQALPYIRIEAERSGADLISVSSHKIYGPKGCGALWIKDGISVDPFMHGGQQEEGLRGGTENVPAIAGFGRAAELLEDRRADRAARAADLRDCLCDMLKDPDVRFNTDPALSVPGIMNIAFRDAEAEGMLFFLNRQGYSLSMGSACTSKSVEPSHVIRAIGVPEEYARGCIRISFGEGQTKEDVSALAGTLMKIYRQQRG